MDLDAQSRDEKRAWITAAAGAVNLVLAMGIGRFSYTALLPFLREEFGLTRAFTGHLATANYVGYLLGAWLASRVRGRAGWFRASLAASAATTLAMGLTAEPGAWFLLRFLSGAASGLAFVLGYSLAFGRMPASRRIPLSGALFSGVGLGIALSALLAPWLTGLGGSSGAWIGLGLASAVLAVVPWTVLTSGEGQSAVGASSPRAGQASGPGAALRAGQDQPPGPGHGPQQAASGPDPRTRALPWLLTAYGLEGLGYIVSATFLPAVVVDLGGSTGNAASVWFVTGLAAAPSAALWGFLARRGNPATVLVAAYLIQAAGVALPGLLARSWPLAGAMGGALLFGATFMGITTLATALGATLTPEHTARTVGRMTALYGLGQVLGPWGAGLLADAAGGYVLPLYLSAGVVLAGAALLVPALRTLAAPRA